MGSFNEKTKETKPFGEAGKDVTDGISETSVTLDQDKAAETAKKEKPVKEIIISEEEEKIDNVIELSTSYVFEGETVDTIDMTGIENMNAMQMQKAEGLYRKITKNVSTTPELTVDYALAVAHILTGYPLEFLKRINAKDAVKIKNRVINFLYSED